MLKKIFFTAAAAAAVSVSLVGVAGADPAPDNPGVPKNIGGISPGSAFSDLAKAKGSSVPDEVSKVTGGQFRTPGQALRPFTPGHTRQTAPPDEPTPPNEPAPPTPPDEPTPTDGGGTSEPAPPAPPDGPAPPKTPDGPAPPKTP
jgi:hypothetical protein